jgi:hypothetical protein
MFSKNLFIGACAAMMFALVAIVPVSAQFMNPDVDDVLDNPSEFVNKDVTLEGEVDKVYSDRVFAIEDDADIFGEDHILAISVLPNTMIQDLDRKITVAISDLKEGKIARASGTIRMFDRAALESEFGAFNVTNLPANFDASQPVLIIGAREYLAQKRREALDAEQVAALPPPPAPMPERMPETLPTEQPTVEEPAQTTQVEEPVVDDVATEDEAPAMNEETALPKTASPIPFLGLLGAASLAAGFVLRRRG